MTWPLGDRGDRNWLRPGWPSLPVAMTIIALVVVGGCYSILAFRVLSPNGMYSSDVAVKYVQARSLSAQRFRTLDIPYPAQALDPARRFQPLRAPYVITID